MLTDDKTNYADCLLAELDSEYFDTHLIKIESGPHKGLNFFVICGTAKTTENTAAFSTLGLYINANVAVTLARPCGRNKFLYNFTSLCPKLATEVFMSDEWIIALSRCPRTGSAPNIYRIENDSKLRSRTSLEFAREWWERLFKGTETRGGAWGTTVWCASCKSKYRKLRTCVGCGLVSYCSKKCEERHRHEHKSLCNFVTAA